MSVLPRSIAVSKNIERSTTTTQPVYYTFLEGMRAVAALIVVLNHIYAEVYPPDYGALPSPAWSFLSYFMVLGHLSVTVFIVISGFCLMVPVASNGGSMRGGFAYFIKRRAKRILPPYYLALSLSLLLIATVLGQKIGTHWDTAIDIRGSDVAAHYLMLQNIFGTGRINYVFWSIATEWQLYFTFPLLVYAARRFGLSRAVLAALLVGYALQALLGDTRLARANLHYIGFFALGMGAAGLALDPTIRFTRRRLGVLAACAGLCGATIIALMARWGWQDAPAQFAYYDLLAGLATFCIVLLALKAGANNLIQRCFGWRPLVTLGKFSYSLYLMHVPLIVLLLQYVLHPLGLRGDAGFAVMATIGLVLIVGASYVFFLVGEQPFLNNKRRVGEQVRG